MKNCHLIKADYDEIKRMVGMRQAAEHYGYPADRQGRCLCPFHNDRRPSMKIYPHDRGYYCFSCGSGGDVVTFVGRLYGLDNETAARKLIEDFSLPIKLENLTYRELRERDKRTRQRQELLRFARDAAKILERYRICLCEAARDPKSEYFEESLQMLSITDYRLECLKECPQEVYADKKVVRWIGAVKQRLDRAAAEPAEGRTVPGRAVLPDFRD